MKLVPFAELEEAVERVAPDMIPQQVSLTIWAYGTLGMKPTPLAQLEEAIERVAPDMNPQAVANTIWAYGTLGMKPTPLAELEEAIERLAPDMNSQDVANTIWAYAFFDRSPPSAVVEAAGAINADLFTEEELMQCFQAHRHEEAAGRHLDLPEELLARAESSWCNRTSSRNRRSQ